ncbi:MAG: hypothetical protein KI790_13625 [Cyclobacteriaceae bacterium]|nr:hypothetical protein [Cyclobacteriaceae bacterium HetDA_MAG_MS6]
MKNQFRKWMLVSALGAVVMYGCSSDDSEDPTPDGPELTMTAKVGSTDAAFQSGGDLLAGDSIIFNASVTAPGGFNVLREITASTGIQVTRTDLGLDAGATQATIPTFAVKTSGEQANSTATLTFIAVDENSQTDTVIYEVNIIQGIEEYTAILIGGFNNATLGSFYDAKDDSVYNYSPVNTTLANQEKIDFIYYFADTPQYTLASPDNTEVQATWDGQTTLAWPFSTETENSTKFKAVAQGFDFDGVATGAQLASAYSEVGDGLSRITGLSAGAVYAFQLDQSRGSRYGVLEVVTVEGNSSGSIEINVKVQTEDN